MKEPQSWDFTAPWRGWNTPQNARSEKGFAARLWYWKHSGREEDEGEQDNWDIHKGFWTMAQVQGQEWFLLPAQPHGEMPNAMKIAANIQFTFADRSEETHLIITALISSRLPNLLQVKRTEKKSSKRNQNICYTGVMKSFLPQAGTLPWFAFNSCSFSAWLTSEEINPKSTNVAPELSKKIIPLLPPSLSKHFKEKKNKTKPSCLCNCAQKKKLTRIFQIHRILSSCVSKLYPTFFPHFSFF